MDCGKYQEALSASALGAESGAEGQAFRLHLEICGSCRRELARRREFLASVDRQLVMQSEAVPSGDFNARLRRRIADEPRHSLWPSLRWFPVVAGAAALAMVLAFFHFYRDGTQQPRNLDPVPYAPEAERAAPQVRPAGNSPQPAQKTAAATLIPPHRIELHPLVANRASAPTLEVRIDRRELYAAVLFSRAVADGRIDAAPLLEAQREPDKPVAAKPLEIPPLELMPIEQPSTEDDSTER
jgi:Putative zinc-finger